MIELVIKIVNGEPYEHPIIRENFEQAWPDLDFDNLPPEFARFVRVPCPEPDAGKYIVSAMCSYQFIDDEVRDVWSIVQEPIPEPLEPEVPEPPKSVATEP